jgi:hypothetical protein
MTFLSHFSHAADNNNANSNPFSGQVKSDLFEFLKHRNYFFVSVLFLFVSCLLKYCSFRFVSFLKKYRLYRFVSFRFLIPNVYYIASKWRWNTIWWFYVYVSLKYKIEKQSFLYILNTKYKCHFGFSCHFAWKQYLTIYIGLGM